MTHSVSRLTLIPPLGPRNRLASRLPPRRAVCFTGGDAVGERLSVFNRDDSGWSVSLDGRVVVTFFGSRAHQMAEQEKEALAEWLHEVLIAPIHRPLHDQPHEA